MPEDKPMNQLTGQPTKATVINVFVEKMMADKGVEDTSLREQLKEKLEEQIEQAMIRMLPDEKLEELEAMVDRGVTDDELEKFFDESGVDFQAAIEETMAAFRAAFLGNGEVA